MLQSWEQFQIRVVDQKGAVLISDATPAVGNHQFFQPYLCAMSLDY